MKFQKGELAILNASVSKSLPSHVGDLVEILRVVKSPNYDYEVELANGDINPVKESELNKLSKEQRHLVTYIKRGNNVVYTPTNETVKILKVDMIHGQAEVDFQDGSSTTVGFETLRAKEVDELPFVDEVKNDELGKFATLALEIGQFTDVKNKQYGSSVDATQKMIEVLMERYTYDEENYLIPKSLLQHLLLTVRVMDKQNRIFNNPSGKGDSESPWKDITGYGLIGIDMVAK